MPTLSHPGDLADLYQRFKPQRPLLFTGAGMSAESGLATFRDQGGLWEQYPIEEVATPEAWRRNPQRVLDFYNLRRAQLLAVEPHPGHYAAAALQARSGIPIITQNVDDLHERAGAQAVLHLHGELRKAQSTVDPQLIYPIEGAALDWGMCCEKGSQLRPQVVWFGEAVPAMEAAYPWLELCDFMIVVGSSLQVYPAASLVLDLIDRVPVLVIDPQAPGEPRAFHYPFPASEGLPLWESFSA